MRILTDLDFKTWSFRPYPLFLLSSDSKSVMRTKGMGEFMNLQRQEAQRGLGWIIHNQFEAATNKERIDEDH